MKRRQQNSAINTNVINTHAHKSKKPRVKVSTTKNIDSYIGNVLDTADSFHDFLQGPRCEMKSAEFRAKKEFIKDNVFQPVDNQMSDNDLDVMLLKQNYESMSPYIADFNKNKGKEKATDYESMCTLSFDEYLTKKRRAKNEFKNVSAEDYKKNSNSLFDHNLQITVMIDAISDASFLDEFLKLSNGGRILKYTTTQWDPSLFKKKASEEVKFQDYSNVNNNKNDGVRTIGNTGKYIIFDNYNVYFCVGNKFTKVNKQFACNILRRDVSSLCACLDKGRRKNFKFNDLELIFKDIKLSNKTYSSALYTIINFLSSKKIDDLKTLNFTTHFDLNFKNIFNIKRSGDYGQISTVKKLNEEKSKMQLQKKHKCYLFTLDRLCYLRAKFENVPSVLVKKNGKVNIFNGEINFTVYINYFNFLLDKTKIKVNRLISLAPNNSKLSKQNLRKELNNLKTMVENNPMFNFENILPKIQIESNDINSSFILDAYNRLKNEVLQIQSLVIHNLEKLLNSSMSNNIKNSKIVLELSHKNQNDIKDIDSLIDDISKMEFQDKSLDKQLYAAFLSSAEFVIKPVPVIDTISSSKSAPQQIICYILDILKPNSGDDELFHETRKAFGIDKLNDLFYDNTDFIYKDYLAVSTTRPKLQENEKVSLQILVSHIYNNLVYGGLNSKSSYRSRNAKDIKDAEKYLGILNLVIGEIKSVYLCANVKQSNAQIGKGQTYTHKIKIENAKEQSFQDNMDFEYKIQLLRKGISFDVFSYWSEQKNVHHDPYLHDWTACIIVLSLVYFFSLQHEYMLNIDTKEKVNMNNFGIRDLIKIPFDVIFNSKQYVVINSKDFISQNAFQKIKVIRSICSAIEKSFQEVIRGLYEKMRENMRNINANVVQFNQSDNRNLEHFILNQIFSFEYSFFCDHKMVSLKTLL